MRGAEVAFLAFSVKRLKLILGAVELPSRPDFGRGTVHIYQWVRDRIIVFGRIQGGPISPHKGPRGIVLE